jgi:Response regulator containing a CheY-like receiver domain and an HTH DNA-binding domain
MEGHMEYLPPETWPAVERIVKTWNDYEGMSVRAVIQRLRIFHRHEVPPSVQKALRAGGVLGDAYTIGNDSLTQSTRLQAATRLGTHVGRVIHKRRLPYLEPEIMRRAHLFHRSFRCELDYRKLEAIYDVCGVGSPLGQVSLEKFFRTLRSRLQTSVTNDVLGEGWATTQQREELVSPEDLSQFPHQVEALPDLTEIVRTLDLSQREQEILEYFLVGHTMKDIAALLGVPANNIHQHAYNIRQKAARFR